MLGIIQEEIMKRCCTQFLTEGLRSWMYGSSPLEIIMDRKQKNIEVCFNSRAEVEQDCMKWAAEIEPFFRPDLVIFIAKSGFLFARPLAEYFKCQMIDVIASRQDNKAKDYIKKVIPWMPNWILAHMLKKRVSKPNYYKKSNRVVEGTSRFEHFDISNANRILLVDDSVDTGWSLLKVQEYLDKNGAKGKYKTASYCVLSESENRIKVDFYRFKDKIVITATSRYSREYKEFLNDYSLWKKE